MAAPDYRTRCLRHKTTGCVAVVEGQSSDITGAVKLRIRFGDGSGGQVTLDELDDRFDWLDGVVGLVPPPAVCEAGNVVFLEAFRAKRMLGQSVDGVAR